MILLTVVHALQKHGFSASERSRATVKYALVSDAKIHGKIHGFWIQNHPNPDKIVEISRLLTQSVV